MTKWNLSWRTLQTLHFLLSHKILLGFAHLPISTSNLREETLSLHKLFLYFSICDTSKIFEIRNLIHLCKILLFLSFQVWNASLIYIYSDMHLKMKHVLTAFLFFCRLNAIQMYKCKCLCPKCTFKGKLLIRKCWFRPLIRFRECHFLAFWWNFLKIVANYA